MQILTLTPQKGVPLVRRSSVVILAIVAIIAFFVQGSAYGQTVYTPGYWKSHSDQFSKQYDPCWDNYGGAESPFYTGQSLIDVLKTPPEGSAYYILAHQFIAAWLNLTCLNGSVATSGLMEVRTSTALSDIEVIVDHAESLLSNNQVDSPLLQNSEATSVELEVVKSAVRQDFIATALTLDQFNNSVVRVESESEDD